MIQQIFGYWIKIKIFRQILFISNYVEQLVHPYSPSNDPPLQEHSSVAGGGQVGIKTVIRESYGPNNVKTITTEKVDMKTGQVISSSTSQSHYDVLPKFEESSSSTIRSSFDFARSGSSERSVRSKV